MNESQQQYKIQINPDEFVNLIVGAALSNGLPTQSIDFIGRRSKPMIVIAAAPKSGSTFLSNVVSRATELPYTRLSSAYSTNEHDLYLPALYTMNNGGCVSQLHIKGTFHNAALMKIFGIKPIITVRNIEDTIVSLADDLRTKEKLENFGSGQNGFSFLWQDHAIANLDQASLIDCLIDLALPWYINFYVSWYRLCARGDVDALWVTYEEMMQNKKAVVGNILEFTGCRAGVSIDDEMLNQKYSKFNIGQSGRGSAVLSVDQRARIKRLFSYYPDIDFSKYGLASASSGVGLANEKPAVSITAGAEKILSADELVDIGEAHHKSGRLQEAELHYRKALEDDPGHPGALFYLANIACEDGRLQLAAKLAEDLLRDEPNDAEAWHLLGVVALKEGNHLRASENFKNALAIQPAYAQAHYGLGDALGRLGDSDAALQSFQRAVEVNPRFAEAYCSIGNIFRDQGKLEAALSSYQQAIDVKPDFSLAHENMGWILLAEHKVDDAIAMYLAAIAKNPRNPLSHVSLGAAYLLKNDYVNAAASFERAISLDPNCYMAYNNLGDVLRKQGRFSEALTAFQRAVAINPRDPRLLLALSNAFREEGQLAGAIDCAKKAILLDANLVEAHTAVLFLSQYLPNYSREKIFADHVAFGERFEAPLRKNWPVYFVANPQRRLRVGFVSGDLRSHPVGYFLEGVLRELRKLDSFDIVVYSTDPTVDAVTDRLHASAHVWLQVSALSDDALEQQIRSDNIDILVDLSGHTIGNRLLVFARKPAPIQVSWLGYWETTGLRAIDYILCDRYSVREDEAKFYVERPWYLPSTRLCFTLPTEQISVASLPALRKGHVVFGCFNNLSKMTDRVIAVWSKILKRIPNAQLILKSKSFADTHVRNKVLAKFGAEDVAPERILFELASPRHEYFSAYNNVDIALDPFPFPGGTTSVEGIWMGVPMITLRGDRIVSRQGESILQNLGLKDWIADSEEEYVEIAVRWAQDLIGLAKLRGQLREKLEASSLCDAALFAKNLEEAFEKMWEKYCEL